MRTALAVLFLFLSSFALADDVNVRVDAPRELGAEQTSTWQIVVQNNLPDVLTGALLSVRIEPGTLLSSDPQLTCEAQQGGYLLYRCALPPLAQGVTHFFRLRVATPFRYGTVSATALVEVPNRGGFSATLSALFPRDYLVTNVNDSGPGSLRQAILDVNAQCAGGVPEAVPCRVAFDIEQKLGGDFFHTIRPLTPLPALDVPWSAVDGSTEDPSNTLGPSVALDGSLLQVGNGITVARGVCDVRGIAIGNFPWNGIHAMNDATVNVDRAYIGTNALGLVAAPNGSRGIASERVAGRITNSLIAGNIRSGIYFAGPLGGGVEIRKNRIGSAGLPNGASGIYVGAYTRGFHFTVIADNVISHNAHFGIAIQPAALVIVEPNSIFANGAGAIDIGLDGPTGGVPGILGRGGIVPPPVITSAWHAHGQTTITGTVAPSGVATSTVVYLYANRELEADGFAEAERFVGTARVENGTFSVTVPRDLRGFYVNGMTRRNESVPHDDAGETATSEMGRAIAVQ